MTPARTSQANTPPGTPHRRNGQEAADENEGEIEGETAEAEDADETDEAEEEIYA